MHIKVTNKRNDAGEFSMSLDIGDFKYKDDVDGFCKELEDALNGLMGKNGKKEKRNG